jgi:hypothetical protein
MHRISITGITQGSKLLAACAGLKSTKQRVTSISSGSRTTRRAKEANYETNEVCQVRMYYKEHLLISSVTSRGKAKTNKKGKEKPIDLHTYAPSPTKMTSTIA